MYLFIMYCICNRKLKKAGERETICTKSSPWRTWTTVVRLQTLYDHIQDHISYYKE